MTSGAAEAVIGDLGVWTIHRPGHDPPSRQAAAQIQDSVVGCDGAEQRTELDCSILWSEDFTDGRKYGAVTVRNPFR